MSTLHTPNVCFTGSSALSLCNAQVLPALAEVMAACQSQLLRAIGAACGHGALASLRQQLDEALEDDVQSAKNSFLNRSGGLAD
jgi:hypothetical protein